MDIQEIKLTRVKFAALALGTSMLQSLFEKYEDFQLRARIQEKLKIKTFQPRCMSFMQLYNLCTLGFLKEARPSEAWETDVKSGDNSLGDDIKRLKLLNDFLPTMDSDLLRYKSCHDEICAMIRKIIKRFAKCEKIDFTESFNNIMCENNIEELRNGIDCIKLGGGRSTDILQRYTDCSASSSASKSHPRKYQWCAENPTHSVTQHLPKNETSKTASSSTSSSKIQINTIRDNGVERTGHNTALKESAPESLIEETSIYQRKRHISSSKDAKFMRSQIYFDFVPPPLNHFEYTMKELAGIEKSITRVLEREYLPSTVSKYLSFTFIHGSHLNVTQASLELFNAEPEERENEANRNRIVVIFLDREITFEILERMTKDTAKPYVKRGKVFLVVQSDQLLQDSPRLISTMKDCFDKKLNVINFNEGIKILYDEFYEVKNRIFSRVEKMLKEAKVYCKDDNKVDIIEQRLMKLRQMENRERGLSDPKIRRKALNVMKQSFLRLQEKGLKGYTIEDNTLLLFFQCHSDITDKWIPLDIRKKFPNFKIIQIDHPLFTCHHMTKAGEKLHPERGTESYGTIGMFCYIRDTIHDSPRRYCISSPHVISAGQTAYILNLIELGMCEWPPPAKEYCINVEDISVVRMNHNIQIGRNLERQVVRFQGDRSDLDRRKVIKFGASTFKTIGYVSNTDFVLMLGSPIHVYLIEPDDASDEESRFSLPGDSGAIVLTKFGQNFTAVSMIFGGVQNIPGVPVNNSIAVDLHNALKNYEDNAQKIVELDTV